MRPMCETSTLIFLSLHLVLLLPPYQKAGYATHEPLQKKICEPPRSLPPQSKTASGAPDSTLVLKTFTSILKMIDNVYFTPDNAK